MTEFDPTADVMPARPGCEPAQAALQRLLDGEAAWDSPDAAAHRTGCLDCREELALARSVAAAPLGAMTVPSELTGRLVSAALSARRRRQIARSVGVGIALAAAVLIAVFAVGAPDQTVTETRTVAVVPPPRVDPTPTRPLGESVSEARDAIVDLTRRAASETRDTPALLPSPTLTTNVPDATEGLEPLVDARTGAARSVEPLRNSARRAMNLFLRAADPPNRPAVQ